jgi:hypothetical protein
MDFGISLKKRKENTSKGVAMRSGRNYAGIFYSTLYAILILLLVVICCYRRCCCRRRGYVVVVVVMLLSMSTAVAMGYFN